MFGSKQREDWKGKYRDLLEEHEGARHDWNTQEESLRKLALRLAIAGMGQGEDIDAALQSIVEDLRAGAPPEALKHALARLGDAVAKHERVIADAPAEDLAAFVAELPLPPEAQRGFIDSLDDAQPAARAGVLRDVAAELVDIVSRLSDERGELQAFLEEVTGQLAQFDAITRHDADAARARREETTALGSHVDRQFAELSEEMDAAGDLDGLKSRVRSRLDAVVRRLKDYRDRESARDAEAEQRHAALREEVERLRGRTAELAERCGEQEAKLMHDTLTGVHSRYAYDLRLQEEFQRWLRHKLPLSLAVWDIDHFKNVNDTYGHQAGDRLLAIVGGLLEKDTRVEDFVARVGGEEFVVLFPATDLEAARGLAERLRQGIAEAAIHFQGQPIAVTASCGLSEFRAGDTPDEVYARADAALYRAKRAGRNRCASDEPASAASG